MKIFSGKMCFQGLISIFVLYLFVGCSATKYQPGEGTFAGGYNDMKVGPNMYRISFQGNAYISGEKAYQYTLYRAAEITKENNCKWFQITDKTEKTRTEWGGLLGYVEKPRNAIVIRIGKDKPSGNVFYAEDVINSIKLE